MFASIDFTELNRHAQKHRQASRRLWITCVFLNISLVVSVALILVIFVNNHPLVLLHSFRGDDYEITTPECAVNDISFNGSIYFYSDCDGVYSFGTAAQSTYTNYTRLGNAKGFRQLISVADGLWAIGDDRTVGFFNLKWDLFSKALPESIVSLAATNSELTALSKDNDLLYVTSTGETGTISLPDGVSQSASLSSNKNHIYLADDAIWQLNPDRATWKQVVPPGVFDNGKFINFPDSHALMYKTSDFIYWLDLESEGRPNGIVQRYTSADIGTSVQEVISADAHIFATSTTVYRMKDGGVTSWTIPLQNPNLVKVSAYGFVYVLNYGSQWLFSNVSPIVVILVLATIALLSQVYLIWRHLRRNSRRIDEGRKLLRSLVPDLPAYQPITRQSKHESMLTSGVVVIIIFGGVIVSLFLYAPVVGVLMGSITIVALPYLLKLVNPAVDAESKAYYRRQMVWILSSFTILLVGVALLIYLLTLLLPDDSSFITGVIAFAAIAGGIVFFIFLPLMPFYRIIRGAYARGDFEEALRQTRFWKKILPGNPSYMLLEANILMDKLDLSEASEGIYRGAADIQNQYPIVAIYIFGETFTQLDNEHAEEIVASGLDFAPEYRPIVLTSLRWLLRNNRPQEALQVLKLVRLPKRKPPLMLSMIWESHLCLKEVTLAFNGQAAQAEQRLSEMLKRIPAQYRVRQTTVLYSLGLVKEASGEHEQAAALFEQVRALLPNSLTARWAEQRLEMLNPS